MGVAGSGKTTVGRELAARLAVPFLDADELHTSAAVEQMRRGEALGDRQRDEWIARVGEAARAQAPLVLACSALRRTHRERLRTADGVRIVLLDVPMEEIERRLDRRSGHFFSPELLRDQFATLERPSPDEEVLVVDASRPVAEVVDAIEGALARR